MRKNITKLSLIIILVVVAIGITGCQSQVTPEIPCSIEITSPGLWESLDGNGTYEITWNWIGPIDKEVSIRIIGYTQSEEEIGATLIDPCVLATDESYIWGPNFGASIFENFGSGDNWPWWFKIQIESLDDPTNGFSEFFSIHWDIVW